MTLKRNVLGVVISCLSTVMTNVYAEPMGKTFFLQYIRHIDTLEADYYQTVTGRKDRIISESHGHVMYKQPGLFRWLSADNTLLVNDGENLWQYEPELEQVIKTPINNHDEVFNPLILLGDVDALTQEYRITTEQKTRHGAHYRLQPQHHHGQEIRFIFRDDDLAAIEYRDNLQNINHIELKHIQHNHDIASSWFQFIPDTGIDVIEQ